jgi:hypothetical protein
MDKNIIYVISAIIIVIIVVFIYNFTRTKQNFQKIKHKKPINVLTFSREKLKKALIESANKNLKQWEENKKISSKLFSMQRNHKKSQLRALEETKQKEEENIFSISGVDNQDTTIKPYDPEADNATLLRRISECTLGRIFNLPEKNLENSADFAKKDRRSIFKEINEVGEMDDASRKMAPTIGPDALKNGFISATKDTAMIDGKFIFCSNTREFVQSISDKTTVSAGASYSAVTVKATASFLTERNFSSEMHIQSYNIAVRKFNQSITLSPDNFKIEFLNPDMIRDLSNLGDPELSVKADPDPDKIGQTPVILTGSETPEEMTTIVPNTYINETKWLKCKEFFSKWGSHFVTSIDYGKKLNIWDTMITTKEETTNLMERKMCLQLSYAGYTECTTKCESYKKMKRLKERFDETTPSSSSDDIDLGDIDWDTPVNWDPEPVPGTEDLPSTTTTTTKAPGGSGGGGTDGGGSGGGTGGGGSGGGTGGSGGSGGGSTGTGGCDSCGVGQECKGYSPETDSRPEIMGNCVPKGGASGGAKPGFSAGASICNAHSETDTTTLSSASTTSKVLLQGGDEATSAEIMGKKSVGNSPGIDQYSMVKFLQSNSNSDVPIKYTFKSIWSLLIELYADKCGTFIENIGKYKIRALRSGDANKKTPSCIAYLGKNATDYFMGAGLKNYINGPGSQIKNPNYTTRIIVQADEKTLSLLDNDEWDYDLVSPSTENLSVEADPEYCNGNSRLPSKYRYCSIVQTAFYVDSDFIPITDYKYVGKGKTTPPPGQLTELCNIFYVNDETKENIFEIYVPTYELTPVVDPCRILQAAYNLEAAYISDIVCPYVTTVDYGIIQKIVPLNPLKQDTTGNFLQKYACWNKVTGCQSDRDCIGSETDQIDCSGFWSQSCNLNWKSCQQNGLWHESVMDNTLNGPNASAKEAQYRTLAVRPGNVPLNYSPGPAADNKSYDETTDMRKFAQVSCLSSNTRFFPDGHETGKRQYPKWYSYNGTQYNNYKNMVDDAKSCFCQNSYIPDCETLEDIKNAVDVRGNFKVPPAKCLLNNAWKLDKYRGAVVIGDAKEISDTTGPNILPNRLVWNQAKNVT